MPYIISEERLALRSGKSNPTNPGQLNYMITMDLIDFDDNVLTGKELTMKVQKHITKYCENIGFKYQTANDVVGALICSILEFSARRPNNKRTVMSLLGRLVDEFYQTIVRPYEERKIKENGDVYNSMEQKDQ